MEIFWCQARAELGERIEQEKAAHVQPVTLHGAGIPPVCAGTAPPANSFAECSNCSPRLSTMPYAKTVPLRPSPKC
jgi:hypothetical protein